MGVEPKIPKIRTNGVMKRCNRCGFDQPATAFARTHNQFYPDGYLPVCNDCIKLMLRQSDFSWDSIEKVCQWADIPFIIKEWTRLSELNSNDETWPVYANVFADDCYKTLGWSDYQKQYLRLREIGMIEEEIPLLSEEKRKKLRHEWGENYSDEELDYLDDLYKGLKLTQNIGGALQDDQAHKLCKLSLEVDSRIRAGDKEVDKFLSSYDKLVKTAEFTPKNTKNAADFDSFAEVAFWLEKRGRQNKYYDGATRDVIDEELKTMENYNQRLYINEGGIGEEITERIQGLKSFNQTEESFYDLKKEYDLEEFDNQGYQIEAEDFDPGEVEEDGGTH